MIDEYWTWQFYGYHSDDWADGSHKPIVARCDGCCKYRVLRINDYTEMCLVCSLTTPEHRNKMSEAKKGKKLPPRTKEHNDNASKAQMGKSRPPFSEEHRRNLSNSGKGREMPPITDETRAKMSKSQRGKTMPPRTDEHRQRLSAAHQGIPYEEWEDFVTDHLYCNLFDGACRERVRAKYDYRCFICDRPQDKNMTKSGKVHKLSVHHVDRNRNQGCDGVQWKLVPLCMHCHPISHHDPIKSRLEYLLNMEYM